jgi:hypothetical protein
MSQNDFKTSETIPPQEASPVKHHISAAIPADSLAASGPDPDGTFYGRFESPCGSDAGRMMILLTMLVR